MEDFIAGLILFGLGSLIALVALTPVAFIIGCIIATTLGIVARNSSK